MPDIGYAAIVIALVVSVYATIASLMAARSGRQDLWQSARSAVLVTAALTSLASLILIRAFMTHDFSIRYVAEYSSRDMSAI